MLPYSKVTKGLNSDSRNLPPVPDADGDDAAAAGSATHEESSSELKPSALQSRWELKYLVSLPTLHRIRKQMAPYCIPDPNNKNGRSYRVESIYYDSRRYQLFHENIDGLSHRRKLRVRFYPLSDGSVSKYGFVEIKRKFGKASGKSRVAIPVSQAKGIVGSREKKDGQFYAGLDPAFQSVLEEVWFMAGAYQLRPVVRVGYDRWAFKCKMNPTVRITFDRNVSVARPSWNAEEWCSGNNAVVNRQWAILEIKFRWGIPHWIRGIVESNDCMIQRMSKFVTSVQALELSKRKRQHMEVGIRALEIS